MERTIYHSALSTDIDRFPNRLLRHMTRGITIDGHTLSVAGWRMRCVEARVQGLKVFPPCDNTNADGHCAGHPKLDTESVEEKRP